MLAIGLSFRDEGYYGVARDLDLPGDFDLAGFFTEVFFCDSALFSAGFLASTGFFSNGLLTSSGFFSAGFLTSTGFF